MKKTIIYFLLFIASSQLGFSQKYLVRNDSLSLFIKPSKLKNGYVTGFSFEFSNNFKQQIYFGITPKNEVSCYIYKIGSTLLILCGGTVPALYDYNPQPMRLSVLLKGDTVKFSGDIYEQYKGKIKISKSEYDKMKKVFVIDYIPLKGNGLLKTEDYIYSDFLKNSSRLSLEIAPN